MSYIYCKRKTLTTYTLWRCRKPNCHAIIRTVGNQVIDQFGGLTNEPLNAGELNRMEMRVILRQQSLSRPDDKPAHLIADALSCVNSDRTVTDGDVSKLRRFVDEGTSRKSRRQRQKHLRRFQKSMTTRQLDGSTKTSFFLLS